MHTILSVIFHWRRLVLSDSNQRDEAACILASCFRLKSYSDSILSIHILNTYKYQVRKMLNEYINSNDDMK